MAPTGSWYQRESGVGRGGGRGVDGGGGVGETTDQGSQGGDDIDHRESGSGNRERERPSGAWL